MTRTQALSARSGWLPPRGGSGARRPGIIRAVLCAAGLAVASCTPAAAPPPEAERRVAFPIELPPMKTFAGTRTHRPARSNAQIAQDFLDLTFRLESGRRLDTFTRFEGPITVRVTGPAPPGLRRDLDALLGRLRREAGIEITRVPPESAASITVEIVGREEMRRAVPQAACFVVPRMESWEAFRKNRRSPALDWTTLETRDRMAIFVPSGVSQQEVRDCLHEELAQAIGPLNDLYRLTDSVFNDDNFHTILTGFDMLILRATYAPELRSGMTPEEVAARLPAILARLNPGGRGGAGVSAEDTPREWIEAIEAALGPRGPDARRLRAAKRAAEIAARNGWTDNRRAFSLFALGRLALSEEPDLALGAFLAAAEIYHSDPETRLQAAHVAMQMSAFALSAGDAEGALNIVNAHIAPVAEAENAALLATLLLVKAEALELQGRFGEARAVRREGLGWARYGFGSDREVRERVAEITGLVHRPGEPA